MDINDLKHQALVDFTSENGTTNDLELLWLNGETGENTINDGWSTYLINQGYSGQINDMQFDWLGDSGYTGSLNDRLLQFWTDGIGGGSGDIASMFSIDLWTGNSGAQSIVSDLDLTTEDGLVWIKKRTGVNSHHLYDTPRGTLQSLSSDTGAIPNSEVTSLTQYNADGFSLGGHDNTNASFNYVGWTFRKTAKFFDVVKYAGDGVLGRQLPHSLGVQAGMAIVKRNDGGQAWTIQHVSRGGLVSLAFDTLAESTNGGAMWDDTAMTDTNLILGDNYQTNGIGANYTAYIFAHDADSAGVVQCGGYVGTGLTGIEITLGWKPQYILIKPAEGATGDWRVMDTIRGLGVGVDEYLIPNSTSQEQTGADLLGLTETGFTIDHAALSVNGASYIYMAIREV